MGDKNTPPINANMSIPTPVNPTEGNLSNKENGQLSGNDLTLAEITAMQEQGIQPLNILNIDNDRVSVDFQKYFQPNLTAPNMNNDSNSNPDTSIPPTTCEEWSVENRRKPWQVPK